MKFIVFITLATAGLLVLSQCVPNSRDEQQHGKCARAYQARTDALRECARLAREFPELHTKEDTWLCEGRAQYEYEAALNQQATHPAP